MTASLTQARALASKVEPIEPMPMPKPKPKPKPSPAPFYEEQEIHEIANELEARIRTEFEDQLALGRKMMIDAMMTDRSAPYGYMQIHIYFKGAYDRKCDVVCVTGEEVKKPAKEEEPAKEDVTYHCNCCGEPAKEGESYDCEFCGEAFEEEPTPTFVKPPCTFPRFEYTRYKLATRKSARLQEKTTKKVDALTGNPKVRIWWIRKVKILMQAVEENRVSRREMYTFEASKKHVDTITNLYEYLLNSPVTKTFFEHYRELRATVKHQADQMYSHTIHIRNHMNSPDCTCYSSFTPEQREAYIGALTHLRDCCYDVLVHL